MKVPISVETYSYTDMLVPRSAKAHLTGLSTHSSARWFSCSLRKQDSPQSRVQGTIF